MLVVFTLATTAPLPAQTLTTLVEFQGDNGEAPWGLTQSADGNFYGTTTNGGVSSNCQSKDGCGTVFKITPEGKLTTLYNFCSQPNCADGSIPYSTLVQSANGSFYGTTTGGGTGTACGTYGCGTEPSALSDVNNVGFVYSSHKPNYALWFRLA
jgi:uncharacterized repeat protein (TIGR03803 family)